MNKSIFQVVAVAAASAVLCIGCSEKSDNDVDPNDIGNSPEYTDPKSPYYSGGGLGSGLIGDWMGIEDMGPPNTSIENYKTFISFKSSGDFTTSTFEKTGDIWSESNNVGRWSTTGGKMYLCQEDGDCESPFADGYKVFGNTLIFYSDPSSHGGGGSVTFVRGNIANVRQSLGLSKSKAKGVLTKERFADDHFKAFSR